LTKAMTDTPNTLPEALIGEGFYKLGYVTTDREAAIERLQQELGIEAFVPFEPSFTARTADGREGTASLRCAFSAGRNLLIEVLQPVEGLVDIFAEPLAGASGFKLAFHHFGVLVDDLAAVRAELRERGISSSLESTGEGPVRFSFTRMPVIEHYVEHFHSTPSSMALVDRVRSTPLPRGAEAP
jgi:hypothetical protein